ncbi:MAG: alkaline phosphatase family protein [Chloroflexi bacterium]|nr:alkaline phosphatase family protein [Chloroflexota bacterium]
MTLADKLEREIRAENQTRFRALNLPREFIAPNYDGRSIVNVAASVVKIFGGKISTAPLDATILEKFSRDISRVVLVIIDALAYARFLRALDANPQNGFNALLRGNAQIVPLTSVFPSTTTAALTSLWTGATPAQHGSLGFTQFLRDRDARVNMIYWSPTATEHVAGAQLVAAGMKPDEFLAAPSLPQILDRVNVPVFHHIEKPFVTSALSQMQMRVEMKETRGFVSSSDMWVVLRDSLQARQEHALFTAYWSRLDAIMHDYGPASRAYDAEIHNLAYSFEREFLSRLSPRACEGTLFLLTADHGALDTPIARTIYLKDHPDLRAHILTLGGEPRAMYLYCVHRGKDAARAYIEKELGDKFFILDSRAALDAGLFGGGKPAPEARYRVGDLIVLPRENFILWERADAPTMLGRHGGLHEEEMLVPLLVARLDG